MVVDNKVLTWQVLQGKGWKGPSQCPFCKDDNEDVDHLLVHCSFTQSVWDKLSNLLKQKYHWKGLSLNHYFESCLKEKLVPIKLVVHLCWYVWIERNQVTFEDKSPSIWAVIYKTLRDQSPGNAPQSLSAIKWSPIFQGSDHILAFFDGASILKGLNCGAGGVIKFLDRKDFRWHINGGNGTNSKVELLGAWVSLTIAKLWEIPKIKMLGDSKVIIDWINNKSNLNAMDIEGWKRRTKVLSSQF